MITALRRLLPFAEKKPQLPPTTQRLIAAFRSTGIANAIASDFGAAVRLCGPALYRDDPAEYDVRILISERDYRRRFGPRPPGLVKGVAAAAVPSSLTPVDLSNLSALHQRRWLTDLFGVSINLRFALPDEVAEFGLHEGVRLDTLGELISAEKEKWRLARAKDGVTEIFDGSAWVPATPCLHDRPQRVRDGVTEVFNGMSWLSVSGGAPALREEIAGATADQRVEDHGDEITETQEIKGGTAVLGRGRH